MRNSLKYNNLIYKQNSFINWSKYSIYVHLSHYLCSIFGKIAMIQVAVQS